MKPATMGAPYTVPPEPNRLPAIALALAVHALLLAFLWIGISWQNTEPPAVEAEVWDMKVQSAAAPALPPPPPPEMQEPEPQPEPTPAPPPPPPKVAEPEPVKPAAPDINLEREKKLAEQKKQRDLLEKKERERELAEKKEREEEREKLKAKELAEKKAQEKKELAKKEQEKKELEKKLEEKKLDEKKLAAEKAEAEKKKVAAEKAEKAAKAKKEAAEQARLDKMHADELKRMMGAAGTSGSAQKSSAPKIDAGYIGKLTALIKSNTTFAGSTDVPGNPKAVFRVELLPTGEILSVRLSKSSGVPQFDDAVERGINKSSPLPKKKDGTVERTIVVNFSMKDLD